MLEKHRLTAFFFFLLLLIPNFCLAYNESEVHPTAFHMVDPLDPSGMVVTEGGEYGLPRPYHEYGHAGVDLGGTTGDPVYAAASGTIYLHPWQEGGGKGNCVVIDHGGGLYTTYMHLSGFANGFENGDPVTQSNIIGYVGSTGDDGPGSYGEHLHFQITDGSPWVPAGGKPYNPHEWLKGLPPYSGVGYGQMSPSLKMRMDASIDLAKPVKEFIDTFGAAATKALKLLTDVGRYVIGILFVIDLAISMLFMAIDPSGKGNSNLFGKLVFKVMFYLILVFFVLHWGDYVGNLAKETFTGFGAMSMGADTETAQKTISDPFAILQKGVELIAPVINDFFGAGKITMLKAPLFLLGEVIFATVLFILFSVICFHIALCYCEFYIVVLFSFTTFLFAGVKQGRGIAERGLTGVFSSSIKLFFFCIFSILLQNIMENLSVDSFIESGSTPATPIYDQVGDLGIISSLNDLQGRVMMVESSGDPHSDNGSHHGYWHIADGQKGQPDNWNNWCAEYYTHDDDPEIFLGELDTEMGTEEHTHEEPPNSNYPWTPGNQYRIAHMQFLLYYREAQERGWDEAKCYKAVAAAWHFGHVGEDTIADNKDYWAKVLGFRPGSMEAFSIHTKVLKIPQMIEMIAITLLFVIFGSRMAKLVNELYAGGGNGFKFTTGD